MIKRPLIEAEIVSLDDVRRKRDEKNVKRLRGARNDEQPEHTGLTPALANSISLKDALIVAQSIVKKYSASGALLAAYLERRKREPLGGSPEEFHIALENQKKYVALYTTIDLRAVLVLHLKNPKHFFEIYVLSAAEEYLRRFPKES